MKAYIIAGLLCCFGGACNQQQQPAPAKALAEQPGLPFYIAPDFTPLWIKEGSSRLDSIHHIPAFSFTDQLGDTITERTVQDKIYVADFFFTSCPGICPRLTKNLALVQAAFKNDTGVVLLSHSVTPEKDNAAVLKRYALNYGVMDHKWHLLTGNRDSIYEIARKSYFADEDLGQQLGSNDFLHTENVLLIDGKRRIRGIYKGTSPLEMENLVRDIKTLQKEKRP
jgi:protein SCO1/2